MNNENEVKPEVKQPFDFKKAQDKDLELYHAWKQDPTKKNLAAVMKQIRPIVRKEISRQSGSIPESALDAEATKWAHTALQKFDPTRGVKLSTHVTTWLQKTRRMNYDFRGGARMSEKKQLEFGEFDLARKSLSEDLGRDPTAEELAGHLGWKVPATKKYMSQVIQDVYESSSTFSPERSRHDESYAFHQFLKTQLSREENAMLLLIDKYPGDGRSSATAIANGMGVSIHRYNYLRRKLIAKVAELQNEYYNIHHEK